MTSPALRIAVLGPFDVADVGVHVAKRVIDAEIRRRLPTAFIRCLAPFGCERPHVWDGGDPAEALGPWSESRVVELRSQFDAVVLVTTSPLERLCGLYGATSEEFEAYGVLRWLRDGLGEGPVQLDLAADTPPLTVLAPRVFERSVLERRIRFLRHVGWLPPEGPTLVFGAEASAEDALRSAGADAAQVVMMDFPDDHASHFGVCHHLSDAASLEDVVATVMSSRALVTRDSSLQGLARGFTRPAAPTLPDALGATTSDGAEREQRELDAVFDALASSIARSVPQSGFGEPTATRVRELETELRDLRAAYQVRGLRLAAERRRFSELLDRLAQAADRPWLVRQARRALRPLRRAVQRWR